MRNRAIVLITLGLLLSACFPIQSPTPIQVTQPTPTEAIITSEAMDPTPTIAFTATVNIEVTLTPQPTNTSLPTQTSLPTTLPSMTPTLILPTPVTPTLAADREGTASIVADHTVIEQFDNIPDEYIQAASQLSMIFKHASVGANIDMGLNCLMGNFEGRRPNICDRSLPPGGMIIDPKYDRSNWIFEFFQPLPEQNPGWWNKTTIFVDRVNNPFPGEEFDVAGFKFGYVDAVTGSVLPDLYFNNSETDSYPSIEDLEALEAQHPEIDFIYWTLGLSRSIGTEEAARFNQQMREYAAANDKILMDIAAIESHHPDGSPCTDVDGNGFEALCEEYTREARGGHLDSLGSQRMAKALWWLMARLAGWDGSSS